MASILYLTPRDWRAPPPNTVALLEALVEAEVAGAPLPFEGRLHRRPGERFLQTITFLGCSPVVALGEPGATGEEFCHLELESHSTPHLVTSQLTRAPRCRCGHRFEPWQPLASAWQGDPLNHHTGCPQCGHEANGADLNWRQSAGAGRLFLKVWGVFEGEAVPGDELLDLLAAISGDRWGHFYYRS